MAIPIIYDWQKYFDDYDEGLGSSYERIVINNLLHKIVSDYKVTKILEAPCFGFTGVSGINSMDLAKQGLKITLMDNNGTRMRMIDEIWQNYHFEANFVYSDTFNELPFKDNQFDMSWNFSAIWFVKDLNKYLGELSRVTEKIILIAVPNTLGLGYLWQKVSSRKPKEDSQQRIDIYNKEWIKKAVFIPVLQKLGWKLIEHSLIDSPPWPDIGMKKEDFLKIFGLNIFLDKGDDKGTRLSILDYYSGQDEEFPEKMLKHYWFEKNLPVFLKQFWAHHHYYLFSR